MSNELRWKLQKREAVFERDICVDTCGAARSWAGSATINSQSSSTRTTEESPPSNAFVRSPVAIQKAVTASQAARGTRYLRFHCTGVMVCLPLHGGSSRRIRAQRVIANGL